MDNLAFAANRTPEITINRAVPRMVDLKEASKTLGVSVLFLRHKYRVGELVGIRCGVSSNGKILLNFDRLVDYLNTHTETVEPAHEYSDRHIHPIKI